MNPRLVFALAAALCGLFPLAGCGKAGALSAEKKKDENPAARRFPVRLARVERHPLTYQIEATGALQADDVYRIDAEVGGIVQDVNFNEGDEITPKTVLCRTSPETYRLAAQKAKDAWQKALADLADTERQRRNEIERVKTRLEQAQRDVARRKPGYEVHAISQDEFLTVQDKYDLAVVDLKDAEQAAKTYVEAMRAAAQQKETEWRQAEEDLRKSVIVSPVAGIVDQRLISNGTLAVPGTTPIVQIVGKGLKLKFTVPEQESVHVNKQSKVSFRVMAYPDRDFDAATYFISSVADPKTRLVTCWARVEPPPGVVLKAGFFATVKVVTEEKKDAVTIPLTAAQPTEFGFVVYIAEPEKDAAGAEKLTAIRRKIMLGLQVADKSVEVVEGLKEGETIVSEGANALQDKAPIKDVGETEAAK